MDANDHLPPSPQHEHPSPSSNGAQTPLQGGAGGSSAAAGVQKRYRPAPAKTFQCRGFGECRMVFSRSEHLARHIRKHTGERPFACHCGKQFSRLDNLRQHAQTVHSDKHAENEIMMRELTSLHTQLAARTSKINRDNNPLPPELHNPRRRPSALETVVPPNAPRPGTSTGYEGYGAPPAPGQPPMGVPMPYHHQVPHYPPPPHGAYPPNMPPGGQYGHPGEYPPHYYPPPHVAGQQPYGAPGYPYQYPGHGGPVRYSPYPSPVYAGGVSGQYPNGPQPYDGATGSPGPHTPLSPSSTPLSANSAGQGQSFLGSGSSDPGSQGGGSFLGPGQPGVHGGSPHDGDAPPRSPIDPELHHLGAPGGAGHSFRSHPIPSPGPHSPAPYGHTNGNGHHGEHINGDGSNAGPGYRQGGGHAASDDGRHDGEPLDDDGGFERGSDASLDNSTVERGFRERGAGPQPGFGNPNPASRDYHQHGMDAGRSGFSGAAGRGEHQQRYGHRDAHPNTPGGDAGFGSRPADSSVGHEYGQHPKDVAKEVSAPSAESRRDRPNLTRKTSSGLQNSVVHPEGRFSSERSGRLSGGGPHRQSSYNEQHRDQYFRSSRPPTHSGLGGLHHDPLPTTSGKTGAILPPLSSLVSSRPPTGSEQQLGSGYRPSFQSRDSGPPPGSSGGFAYLPDPEYGRPGTAPAAYISGDGPTARGRLRFDGPRAERLGTLPGTLGGDRRLHSRGGERPESRDREYRDAPAPLTGSVHSQFGFGSIRSGLNTSPVNDSPFTFHPPDVPYQESRDPGSSLNVPRPTSGRPFSGISSLGGGAFSGRPSTANSAVGRPLSSSGFGHGALGGFGLRPGTGTSTTDPASYAFSRGTKRPHTADSSDGGSTSGREAPFRFGGRDRRPDTSASALADDDARPASRRLSLMELCTPPATSSGRPRTAGAWGVIGASVDARPTTADTGSRWTGKTAVDEGDEYERDAKLSTDGGVDDRTYGRSTPSLETDDVDVVTEQARSSFIHSPPVRVARELGQSQPSAGTRDLPGSVKAGQRSSLSASPQSVPGAVDRARDGLPASRVVFGDVKQPRAAHHGSPSPHDDGLQTTPSDVSTSRDAKHVVQQSRETRPQSVLPSSPRPIPRTVQSVRGSYDDGFVVPKSDPDAVESRAASVSTGASDSPRLAVAGPLVNASTPRSASASSSGGPSRRGPGGANELNSGRRGSMVMCSET